MNTTITKFEQSAFAISSSHNETFAFDFGNQTSTEQAKNFGTTHVVRAAFVSHKHPDHLTVANLEALNPQEIFGPSDVIECLESYEVKKTVLTSGKTVNVGSLSITPTYVDHGEISTPIENMAFLLQIEEKRILFLGDIARPTALPFEGPFHAVIVPVGGGKVFNAEEARSFVSDLREVGIVIPVHYHGKADPLAGKQFADLVHGSMKVVLLEVGQSQRL